LVEVKPTNIQVIKLPLQHTARQEKAYSAAQSLDRERNLDILYTKFLKLFMYIYKLLCIN
jgi:hypothetical protein